MNFTPRPRKFLVPTAVLTAVLTVVGSLSAAAADDGETPSPAPTTTASPEPTDAAEQPAEEPAGASVAPPRFTLEKILELQDRREAQQQEPPVTKPKRKVLKRIEFVTASFNVLGANHTLGRGGHGPGYVRGKMAAGLLRKHKTDIVGLQELQLDNFRGFRAILGPEKFGFYPGPKRFKPLDNENAIAWKKGKFRKVRAYMIKIPYFHGNKRRMPVVLLRHRKTGRKLFVANFHNPASTRRHGNNERWRDKATKIQIKLVKRLAKKYHYPIIFTGDFNEHEEYYCKLASRTQMKSASGGRPARKGVKCRAPRPRIVDLIFGARKKGVRFMTYRSDKSRQVRRTTDHPLIVARTAVKRRTIPVKR